MFELIKNIEIEESTWKDKLFITSDIDWASDEVLDFTINLFEKYNAKCTFFATHQTDLISDIPDDYEIGLHPNFNFLLEGDFRYGKNYKEIIDYYNKLIPNCTSIRSHSMTQNTNILDYFSKIGFTHDVNHFIPNLNCVNLSPWKYWQNKMLKVPYFWEDDIHCIYGIEYNIDNIFNYKGIKVIDFHPIHIFLNTENLERYNSARPYLQDYTELKQFVNTSTYGTRDFLVDIIKSV